MLVEDETGDVLLVFFLANHQWIEKSLPVGATRWISGKLELWDGHRQMVHPDRVLDEAGLAKLPPVEPVYGLTEGLHQRVVAKAVGGCSGAPAGAAGMASLRGRKAPGHALLRAGAEATSMSRKIQAIFPRRRRRGCGSPMTNSSRISWRWRCCGPRCASAPAARIGPTAGSPKKSLRLCPSTLTGAQAQALAEIRQDLAAPARMLRLLQGDVGSGKTVVALFAMAHVVEAGRQAALMAPTEILARQHYESMTGLANAAGLRLALLTGRDRPAERARTLAALAAGEIDIAIGTHALFQEASPSAISALPSSTSSIASACISASRSARKARRVGHIGDDRDADPAHARADLFRRYGYFDIAGKAAGPASIDTRALPLERLDEVVERLAKAMASGARAYWVCPLVEESEELDVAAAEARVRRAAADFRRQGRASARQDESPDKDRAMAAFARARRRSSSRRP